MGRRKRKVILLTIAGILGAAAVILLLVRMTAPSKEFTATQAIIENLPEYQDEIESWGYQVSVYDPAKESIEDAGTAMDYTLKNWALLYYSGRTYHPVLILKDSSGGYWFFHTGFDQYAQETTTTETAQLSFPDETEETVQVTRRLTLQKTNLDQPASFLNRSLPGEQSYYDVEVSLYVDARKLDTGEEVWLRKQSNLASTQYCSNNFEEHKLFHGIDPVKASRNSDYDIKQSFSAKQLSDWYHQGLDLQDRLMELYYGKEAWNSIREQEQAQPSFSGIPNPFSSFRVLTMSDQEVEDRLEERYGEPFTVLFSEPIGGNEQVEEIWAARVYTVVPERNPEEIFFAYSTVEGETFGVPGFRKGLSDTYQLDRLKSLLEETAVGTGWAPSFTYFRAPFQETEEHYYSAIRVEMDVTPQNLDDSCELLSVAIQKFVDETGLTPSEDFVNTAFLLRYREEEWPDDYICSVRLDWNDAISGPLDYRAESIRNTMLYEIEDFKERNAERLKPDSPETEPEPSNPTVIFEDEGNRLIWNAPAQPEPGIIRREDGSFQIQGDEVRNPWNEQTQHSDFWIWSEEEQQWTIFVWNGETQQYEPQTGLSA